MATIYDNLPRNKILLAILNAYGGVATNPNSQDAILADIVVACGGVVTNPNNRNSLLADIVEATSGCNVYPFSSADADYLEIAPFTGNFKIILAATSETGIPAAIQAGLQGSFISSTDPVNDPQWNQYEIDGAVPAVVLEVTFTGVCGGYAKDDVWSYVSMGVPETRLAPKFDGVSTYIEFNSEVILSGDFSLLLTCEYTSGGYVNILSNSDDSMYIRTYTLGRLQIRVGGNRFNFSLGLSVGVNFVELHRVGTVVTLVIDGSSESIDYGVSEDARVNIVGSLSSTTGFWSGMIYDVNLDGEVWAFDESFAEYPTLTSSLGNTATAYNFTSDDVVEITE